MATEFAVPVSSMAGAESASRATRNIARCSVFLCLASSQQKGPAVKLGRDGWDSKEAPASLSQPGP
jgi:hypothetical protein